ncbi:MAG: hypothetical protein WD673_08930 [Alphaproteobacteria bacterium]
MTLEEFTRSVAAADPPDGIGHPLAALWWDAKGDWNKAHAAAQRDDGEAAMRVHAYLHRKEGDADNARYWYRRVKRAPATGTLDQEWTALARDLLD